MILASRTIKTTWNNEMNINFKYIIIDDSQILTQFVLSKYEKLDKMRIHVNFFLNDQRQIWIWRAK